MSMSRSESVKSHLIITNKRLTLQMNESAQTCSALVESKYKRKTHAHKSSCCILGEVDVSAFTFMFMVDEAEIE